MPVLVIDPCPVARHMVADAVKWADGRHVVAMADDGASGWQQALRIKPELVICDPVLPDICGQELCGRLAGRLPESTFLAFGYNPVPKHPGAAAFSGYLPKPPARTDIFACLCEAKARKRRFKLRIAKDENRLPPRVLADDSPAKAVTITMGVLGEPELKFSIQAFDGAPVGSVLRRTGKTLVERFALLRGGAEIEATLASPIRAGDTLLIRDCAEARL
jgi:DNA-binding NarL/FixJ family response regulator